MSTELSLISGRRANIAAEIEIAQAQTTISSLVLEATASLFDALGASATSVSKSLDRYWRNARTITSHNPRIYKDRIVGDFVVNGAPALSMANRTKLKAAAVLASRSEAKNVKRRTQKWIMTGRIIDIRNRPAFLHDFYGARRGTPEFDAAKWLNGRTGSKDPEHFVRSQSEAGYLDEIRSAGIDFAVVIGRDTPVLRNDNDQIADLVSRHPELLGIGSVDPARLGPAKAGAEAERAVKTLGLKGINLEPGFRAPPRHFDDPVFHPLYEALQDWKSQCS